MTVLKSFLIVLLGVGLTLGGDVFIKKSLAEGKFELLLGVFLYTLGAVSVYFAFRMIPFGSVFLIWEALTVILALIIASLYFKEPFTTYKALACIFAVLALYFSYK